MYRVYIRKYQYDSIYQYVQLYPRPIPVYIYHTNCSQVTVCTVIYEILIPGFHVICMGYVSMQIQALETSQKYEKDDSNYSWCVTVYTSLGQVYISIWQVYALCTVFYLFRVQEDDGDIFLLFRLFPIFP
jgi:Trk-type K+ transport system membrane component